MSRPTPPGTTRRSPAEPAAAPPRLILLGASNLTRAFPTVLATARRVLGADGLAGTLDVFAAAGHGRSYGRWSRVLHRGLPGIVGCGLWPAALPPGGAAPAAPLRALVTDIGNDILYGARPEEIAGWVGRCLERLAAAEAETVLTRLPLAGFQGMRPWQFQILRSLLYPTHGIAYTTALRRAEELDARLAELATRYGVQTVEPDASWYGPDRIHLRRRLGERVWSEVLSRWPPLVTPTQGPDGPEPTGGARLSRLTWWRMAPERRTVFGVELRRRQPTGRCADGTRVWLY